ncbi:MAG: GNAT family N-acetyltransferase [Patescibacteria group bacterium]
MRGFKLVGVYREKAAAELLYRLLKERSAKINISHRKMPTWHQHLKFIRSKPYKAWYLISDAPKHFTGGIYLSKADEIGIFLLKKYQRLGHGNRAVDLLIKKHRNVKRFLANVNPNNKTSIQFFKKLGFGHIQNTYERRRSG